MGSNKCDLKLRARDETLAPEDLVHDRADALPPAQFLVDRYLAGLLVRFRCTLGRRDGVPGARRLLRSSKPARQGAEMTKVFVHGNPETTAVWGPLVAELNKRGVNDIVLLSPPGFGVASDPAFPATRNAYREWLAGQLKSIGGRIDLVGHDWGAGHTFGIVAHHRELVSTWAADCGGLLHPDYVWHELAQGWQTPEVGEQMIAGWTDLSNADKIGLYTSFGIPEDIATNFAQWLNEDMGRCILAVYRSAAQPDMIQLGQRAFTADHSRGLVIVPPADPFVGAPEVTGLPCNPLTTGPG